MTLNEFKAWLEGYEASITPKGAGPNATQWAAIKAKLASVQMLPPAPGTLQKRVADRRFCSEPARDRLAAEAPTLTTLNERKSVGQFVYE